MTTETRMTPLFAKVDGLTKRTADAMSFDIPEEQLARAAGRMRVAFLAAVEPETLMKCDPASLAKCVALSAITGLYPGAAEMKPDVWLIPRGNQLCWQMGAASYKRLARRGGYELEPFLVYDGERIAFRGGTSPAVEHEINIDIEPTWDRLRMGYVIITHLTTGRRKIARLTKTQLLARRKVSQTDKVWKQWPLEMALKTLCNYAGQREMFPLDDATRAAMAADNEMQDAGTATVEQGSAAVAKRLQAKLEPEVVVDDPPEPEAAAEADCSLAIEVAMKEAGAFNKASKERATELLLKAKVITSGHWYDTPASKETEALEALAPLLKASP